MRLTSKSKVKPIGQKFLVRPLPDQDRFQTRDTKITIHRPDVARDKPIVGHILAIGDGKEDTSYVGEWPPDGYKVGSLIIFGKYAGTEIPLEDTKEEEWPRIIGIAEVQGLVEG